MAGDGTYYVDIVARLAKLDIGSATAEAIAEMKKLETAAVAAAQAAGEAPHVKGKFATPGGAAEQANYQTASAYQAAKTKLASFGATAGPEFDRQIKSMERQLNAAYRASSHGSQFAPTQFEQKAARSGVTTDALNDAEVITARNVHNAQIQKALAEQGQGGGGDYAKARSDSEIAYKQQVAQIQALNAASDDYAAAQATAAIAVKEQAAKMTAVLAADDVYAKTTAELAYQRGVLKQKESEQLASPRNIEQYGKTAAAQEDTDRRQRLSKLQATGDQARIDQEAYVKSQELARKAQEAQALSQQRRVFNQDGSTNEPGARTASVEAEVAAAEAQRAAIIKAETQFIKAADEKYIEATAQAATDKIREGAAVAEVLNADGQYAAAQARAAIATNELAFNRARALNTSAQVDSKAQAALEQAKLSAAERSAKVGALSDPALIQQEAAARAEELGLINQNKAALAAELDVRTAAGAESATAEAEVIATMKLRAQTIRAQTESMLAADAQYLQASVEESLSKKQRAAAIKVGALGGEITDATGAVRATDELTAEATIRGRIAAEKAATDVVLITADTESGLGKELAAAIATRVAAEREAGVASLAGAGSGAAAKAGGAAASAATGGGVFGSLKSLGSIVPAIALFSSIGGIKKMVTAAEELQKSLVIVKAEFVAADDGAQFPKAKEAILAIARETGQSAAGVSQTLLQFKAAFGSTDEAIVQTESAMKLAAVSGLSLTDVVNNLSAVSLNSGQSIEELGGFFLGLQEKTGVTVAELVQFSGQIAPVADEVGLTVKQLTALGAVGAKLSGRTATSFAEAFSRVLPAIGKNAEKIQSLFDAPNLKPRQSDVQDAFASGDTGQVLHILLQEKALGHLSKAQEQYALSTLGSRRETSALIALFKDAPTALSAFDHAEDKVTGKPKLDTYFKQVQSSVKNASARMGEAFKQIGTGLFDAGVGNVLVTLAGGFEGLATAIGGVLGVFKLLNDVTGGYSGKILGVVGAFLLVAKAVSLLGAAQEKHAIKAAASAEATATAAAAKEAEALATAQDAAAESALSAARVRGITLTEAEITAVRADAAVKATEGAASRGGLLGRVLPKFAGGAGYTGAAGAGLGVLPAIGIVAVGVGFAKSQFDSNKAKAKEAEKKLREQAHKADEAELHDLESKKTDWWGRMKANLFDVDLPETIARNEREDRFATDVSKKPIANISALLASKYATQLTGFFDVKGTAEAAAKEANTLLGRSDDIYTAADKKALKDIIAPPPKRKTPKPGDRDYIPPSAAPPPGGGVTPVPVQFEDVALTGGNINLDKAALQKLAKEAPKNPAIAIFLSQLNKQAQLDPKLKKLMAQVLTEKQKKDLEGDVSAQIQTLDDATGAFEGGQLPESQYLAAINATITRTEAFKAKKGGTFGPGDKESADLLNKADKQIGQFYVDKAKSLSEAAASIASLRGEDSKGAEVKALIGQIGAKIGTGPHKGQYAQTDAQQLAQLPALAKAEQDAFKAEIDAITDPVEKLRKLKAGFNLSPLLQKLIELSTLKTDPSYSATSDQIQSTLGDAFQASEEAVLALAVETGKPVKEAWILYLKDQIAKLKIIYSLAGQGLDLPGLPEAYSPQGRQSPDNPFITGAGKKKIDDLNKALFIASAPGIDPKLGVDAPGKGSLGAEETRKAQEQADADLKKKLEEAAKAAEEERQRQHDLAIDDISRRKIVDRKNPVKLAADSVAAAEIELKYAKLETDAKKRELAVAQAETGKLQALADQTDAQKAYSVDAAKAKNELHKARLGNQNALGGLYDDQANALLDVGAADPGPAKDRALAALESIKNSIKDSVSSTLTAINDGLIGIAEAAGDTVKVAELQLREAKRKLDEGRGNGAGKNEMQALKNQYRAQSDNLVKTRREDKLSDLDYLYQMDQITAASYVKSLQGILAGIPESNKKLRQQINLQIKGLRDALGKDLQFNLPSEIKLPTLYEVRRLKQSQEGPNATGSTSYQDNRQISVVLNANNSIEGKTALKQVVDAINAPSRSGYAPRAY